MRKLSLKELDSGLRLRLNKNYGYHLVIGYIGVQYLHFKDAIVLPFLQLSLIDEAKKTIEKPHPSMKGKLTGELLKYVKRRNATT